MIATADYASPLDTFVLRGLSFNSMPPGMTLLGAYAGIASDLFAGISSTRFF
jgi:hypothetical protein